MPGQFVFREREYPCPVELALSAIQGKWKVLVLWHLRTETLRYSELKRALRSVTDKMLSQTLRDLESDGLLLRKVFPVVPPKTEYSLSDEGKTLIPVLSAMQKWGVRHRRQAQSADPSVSPTTVR